MSRPAREPGLSAGQLRRAFDAGFAVPPVERRADLEPFLALRIASTAYAVRLLEIAGVAPATKIVRLASDLPGMLGLAAVRGVLLPVYDLQALLGGEPATGLPSWFLLCGRVDRVALSFSGFEGHVLVSRADVHAADGESRGRHVRELARVSGAVRAVIDVHSLVGAIQQRVPAVGPTKEP
jgi:chemotaxis signal transduction protein